MDWSSAAPARHPTWFGGRLAVPHAGKLFDADGQLTDADVRERLRIFIGGFVQSVRERQTSPR